MFLRKQKENLEGIEKLESILSIKPALELPPFKEDLFFSFIEEEFKNEKGTISYQFYLKVAATIFIIIFVSFLYIKLDLLKKIEFHQYSQKYENTPLYQEPEVIGIVSFVKGKVEILDEKSNTSTLAYVGNTLNENSLVKTKSNSFIEILLEKKILIRINPDTEIKLQKHTKAWKIYQDYGESYHYVKNLSKGEQYFVETPTLIAGVRGTFFKVKNTKSNQEIEVEKGTINVYYKDRTSDFKQIKNIGMLDNYSILIYDEKKQIFEKKDTKKSNLSVILGEMKEHVKILENENLWEEIAKIPKVVNKSDIERVYNRRLEIISLKDGRKLQGVIASQIKEKVILHTTDGIFIINIKDIREIHFMDSQ